MVNESTEPGIPGKAQLKRHGSDLEIILEGPGPYALAATIIALCWLFGIAAFFDGGAEVPPAAESTELAVNFFDTRADIESPARSIFDRFFALCVLIGVGVGLIYYAAGEWLNKIHLYLDQEKIEVRHRPLPWLGCRTVSVPEIKQLYATEIVEDEESGWKSSEVNLITRNDEDKKFIGFKVNGRGIGREQARFVVREIEKYLNR